MEKPVSLKLTSGDHVAVINGQNIHYHVSDVMYQTLQRAGSEIRSYGGYRVKRPIVITLSS